MTQTRTNRREAIAGLTAFAGIAAAKSTASAETGPETLSASFHLDDVAKDNAGTDGPWLQFFENNTMFSGLYEIPAGGEDRQSPHKVDELYFVAKGKAVLNAGSESYVASAGSIFFVKAEIPHGFVEIEEDLQVLVFFSKADSKGG